MPNPIIRAILIAILILTGGTSAAAQQLVQVRFEGALDTAHLVEVEVAWQDPALEDPVEAVLHLHLASGTSAPELAELVSHRLQRAGAGVTVTAPREAPAASLWIDGATAVRLRLGAGLGAEIACTEGPPSSVRIEPPTALDRGPAVVMVTASAAIRRNDQPPLRRHAQLGVELSGDSNSAEATTALFEAAKKTWMTERRGGSAWRPIRLLDGSRITGLSVRLDSNADWRVEIGC
ncbi:MAG: hypothetical protein AAFZ87_04605 [Planctomycetota bacterium]